MYNNGNSSKNVTGASVVDGTLENADFPDNGLSGDKIDGGIISNFQSTGIDDRLPTGKILTLSTTGADVDGTITCDGFTSTGIDDNATSTAITIDASEHVGIGIATPSATAIAQVYSTTAGVDALAVSKTSDDGRNALYVLHASSGATRTIAKFASNLGTVMSVSAGGDVDLGLGNLVIGTSGKGIDFSATSDGSGTSTSELLDDYEEGAWSGNVVTGTATVANETYTKIGRSVTVTGNIYSFSDSTTAIEIIVTGLPYVVNSSSLGAIGGRGIPLSKGYAAIGTNGQSQFKIMEQSNTTAYTFMKHSALIYASSSSTKMYFSFTYESN